MVRGLDEVGGGGEEGWGGGGVRGEFGGGGGRWRRGRLGAGGVGRGLEEVGEEGRGELGGWEGLERVRSARSPRRRRPDLVPAARAAPGQRRRPDGSDAPGERCGP